MLPADRRTGLLLLAVSAVGWGLNWPAMKLLLREWPPLAARGTAGIVAAVALALLAASRGESLAVPRGEWPRLTAAAAINVTAWMGLSTLAMLWLSAGEGALVVYTMPIWATLLAWPVLGERPTLRRLAALALGVGGMALLFAGAPLLTAQKLPGIALALVYLFPHKEDWRGAAAFLTSRAQPGAVVFLVDEDIRVPLEFYYRQPAELHPVWRGHISDQDLLPKVEPVVEQTDDFWLVSSHTSSDALEQFLLRYADVVESAEFRDIEVLRFHARGGSK